MGNSEAVTRGRVPTGSYIAGASIPPNRLCKHGATAGEVIVATATDGPEVIGVSMDGPTKATGDHVTLALWGGGSTFRISCVGAIAAVTKIKAAANGQIDEASGVTQEVIGQSVYAASGAGSIIEVSKLDFRNETV